MCTIKCIYQNKKIVLFNNVIMSYMTHLHRIKKLIPCFSFEEILTFLITLLIHRSVPFPEVVEPEPPVSSLCGLT